MIEFAMEHDQVIGMVQPIEQEQENIYKIGCLGKIEQCQQLPNENYLIRLNGVIRFQIEKELEVTTQYRQVVSNYSNFIGDLEEGNQDLDDPESWCFLFLSFKSKVLSILVKVLLLSWLERIEVFPSSSLCLSNSNKS